jgi:hypothetical protein
MTMNCAHWFPTAALHTAERALQIYKVFHFSKLSTDHQI